MSLEVKPSSERKCTNIPALVFAIIFIAITVILVTYCGIRVSMQDSHDETDLSLFDDHTDSCGNVCGQKNIENDTRCGDPDMTDFPKLLIRNLHDVDIHFEHDDDLHDSNENDDHSGHYRSYDRNSLLNECVRECRSDYVEIDNKCFDADGLDEITSALKSTWYYIIIICFVAFVFSYVFLILFRHAAKYVIWVINIAFVVFVFAMAILSAVAGSAEGLIMFGLMGIILIVLLIWFRKRIALVAKLFKEASKALIDVPSIMFEPVLTFISLIISFLIFATFAVIISFVDDEDPLAAPAHIFNLISFVFITQFIIGCQNFIIAGTICRWYFTRDKTKLHKPVKKSFSHLFKFHLGSVCLGAILITVVKIIKAIITSLKNSARDSKNVAALLLATCCMCLFDMIEKLLAFLVRNAYIVVAKEGTPFCDSGKRAYRLLMDNITDVIALNHFGDLVLMVCRLLITLIAGVVGYTILNDKTEYFVVIPLIIGCILAFLIAHCFVMVFEMTVDTIFISFCIDLEENDGETKPYYMSESLKKIIMEMKEHSGGTLTFGPKSPQGIEGGDGSGMPMLPTQPMYPNIGYGDPNNPQQFYPQQPTGPYTQQPQPGYPPVQPYPQKY